jgi:HD-GYP domain-containing protein (c-di-GMP phosphodiesterase class II)
MGRTPSVRRIKRAIQLIVDQVLENELSITGLTTLREYDEYTFTHSVNVSIFAVALGKRLGFDRLQLYDLGLSALMHDIGKARLDLALLHKEASLDEQEWRLMQAHPWLGALTLFRMRDGEELPWRAILAAHEHHMKVDLTGYPRNLRPRQLSIFSKVVAVADGFDAATTRRSYQTEPLSPAAVLQEMRDNPRRGMDPVIVKAFITLTGIYPVGTLVVLDTFELGVVHAPNASPEMISRPVVRIISDALGNLFHDGPLIDLAERDAEGHFRRTIIKTADPERYGIRVGDYFV